MKKGNWLCIFSLREQRHKVNRQAFNFIRELREVIDMPLGSSPSFYSISDLISIVTIKYAYQSNFCSSSLALASHSVGNPNRWSAWYPSYVGGANFESLVKVRNSLICSSGMYTVKGEGALFALGGTVEKFGAMVLRIS